jgi:hypothetical protein
MILSIDQSRHWRAQSVGTTEELARFLEAFFEDRPGRRPASAVEVFLLSRALECPEGTIEGHDATTYQRRPRLRLVKRKIPEGYSPTMPSCTAQRTSSATVCTPSLFMIRPR